MENMSGEKKLPGRFPCHLYEIQDAKEAYEAIDAACVKHYGSNTALEDGMKLHRNYPEHHEAG